MFRFILCLSVIAASAAHAEASLHSFRCTGPSSPNEITILSPDGDFELLDVADNSGFRYHAAAPLRIEVLDDAGAVELDLSYVAVLNDQITMVFEDTHADPHQLELVFSATGTTTGDDVPTMFGGLAVWELPGHFRVGTLGALSGFKGVEVVAVPEPSAFGFGALALGLVYLVRRRRRPS